MAQFFNILQLTAAIFYPLAVSLGAEALVSITRVQDFLLMEDQDTTSQGLHCNEIEIVETKSTAIELINITATWEDYKHRTLENVNLKVKAGELCAIIGDVGAGKSSLLQLLLGELPIYSGDAIVNGEISYGSQEPWLFTGTVRHNILFGQEYDKKRYHDVVKHCALLTDFAQLPEGDRTLVGERGTSLSGGQRARVSLARAVYKNASIYLLDDPLSAVDAHVGRHLFDECIGPYGYLASQNATRVLVTHQVHFLKDADWIVIMEHGRIMQQGTYKDLMNSELDFAKLLERPCEESDGEEDRLEDYDEDEIPFMDGLTADGYMPIPRKSSMTRSKSGSGSKLVS
jgi:ATP-binding cassette, subfamily C (CFTR/MRP), member 4